MVRGVQNKWKHVEFQRGIVNLFWFIPLSPRDEWILKIANWPIELRDCSGGPILTYFFAAYPMTAPKQSHCPIQHNTGPVLRLKSKSPMCWNFFDMFTGHYFSFHLCLGCLSSVQASRTRYQFLRMKPRQRQSCDSIPSWPSWSR